MDKPKILTIDMVPAGVDLVLTALSKLPYEQAAPLIQEIQAQAMYQMQPDEVSVVGEE
jgi:hypothetical protein